MASLKLQTFLAKHAGRAVHLVGGVDHDLYKVISIEVTPYKSGKYSHFHVRLYQSDDPYGYPVKREDIGMVDGRLCWRNDLEHYSCTFSGGSWVDIINEIKKVYIKDLGESEWRATDWINDEDDIDCAVCYKNWNVNMVLPCGHKFCKQCILQWAKVQNTCPCCRREFVVKFNTML